jgi:hypothetical protein
VAISVSNTAYGIIADAMVDVGFLQEGQRPDSEQLANYMRRLNDIVNLWQTYGLKLFLQQEISFNFLEGVNTYNFGPAGSTVEITKPSRILQGYVTANNVRRPLVMISVDEWERLGQVIGNNGQVNSFMVRKWTDLLIVYVWPTPDATEVLNQCTFLFQIAPAGPILLSDATSFPQEWRIALRWALAEDICTGQPQTTVDRCVRNAQIYREQLEGWDVEDAPTYFGLDMRTTQGYGRFR